MAPVTMHINQTKGADGVYRLTAKNMVGDREMSAEERILDFQAREVDSPVGKLQAQTEMTTVSAISDSFLSGGWEGDDIIHTFAEGPDWTLEQVWGLALVGGEKRHVRRLVCIKGSERKEFTLVYDWTA